MPEFLSRTWRRPAWVVRVLLVGSFAAFAGSVLLRSSGPNPWLDAGLYNVPFVVAALACFLRRDAERTGWWILGVAIIIYAAASVYSTLWINTLANPPYPSLADAGWVAFYPLAYASQVVLARREIAGLGWANWLDGLIAGLAGAAFGAALVLKPIIADTSGSVLTVATNLTYPIGDFLLLALIMALSVARERGIERRTVLLSAGLGLFAIGDTVLMFEAAQNAYVEGGPLDLSWPAAIVLVGLAASLRPTSRTSARSSRIRVVLPMLFALVALAVLGVAAFRPVVAPAIVAALIALVAAVGRVGISFRQLQELAAARLEAQTDELTGLGNRRRFYADLAAATARAQPFCLLMVDLDRFKEVNDALGHHVGDQLLASLAPRLAAAGAAAETTIVRLGGDEFGLIVAGGVEAGQDVAIRVLAAVAQPTTLDDLELVVTASVGIAAWPIDATDAPTLVRAADVAMYTAKRAGGDGCQLYAAAADIHNRSRLELTEELRVAIRRGDLILHYQPKVNIASGTVEGVEALVRWNHQRRGLVPPDQFISLAEETGLMRPLTTAVLEMALAQARRWSDDGRHLPVAVNVSATSFIDTRLLDEVAGLLARFDVPGHLLELEITEHTLMTDPGRARKVIGDLAGLGVRVAIDDFGTGNSSLSYLRDLPVAAVKLDRSFVTAFEATENGIALVRATIDLVHALGLHFVAEGVETADTMRLLRADGCDAAQGYYLTKPLPAAELTAWIDAQPFSAAA